ncbi:MAG: malic enzyme [Candidatus Coatesbacteria bacterium RBG_13_66_14]|uniref:Malic enzyme n=1 Tax=Candidatus Coatesbacteria bacterium RBG_13_66_14 TaxID=1817816 RepID=A0A1F5F4Z7_9BACT|nr:MAG: malic enzyme [Candidatus Coatesbacteria bacterium RBG_13_66_14]
MAISREEALEYHSRGRAGKIEVVSTKRCRTQRDLSLAYTPGVAIPCLEIEEEPSKVYDYTAKGNLVAVISNGTAVLGLGDIGPAAGKPVMEGKGVLFKRFADIDVFDLEIASKNPEEIIRAVEMLEPTFGGINLEDIAAPDCFVIEEELKKRMSIPVFHDDQHGTAIISGAALLNALELNGKDIGQVRLVVSGAGASAIACTKYYVSLGLNPANILLVDSKGVIFKGRKEGMNPYKEQFAVETDRRTLAEAMKGADVFLGLSVGGLVTQDMVRTMASDPIIFAMANPDPEISYPDAMEARSDAIMATGRSDYPNQVNNVLGFPFIFRGALDVRATDINETMKHAATKALADLAKEDVPDSVCKAYDVERLSFGREYLIPKPFDFRVLIHEASAVARAAMESGVARVKLDLDSYREMLEARLGKSREIMRLVINKARKRPARLVFPEGEDDRILRASAIIVDEGIARPTLLGRPAVIEGRIRELGLDLEEVEIINPSDSPRLEEYAEEYFGLRQRKGRTLAHCRELMRLGRVYGPMMVRMGDADSVLTGITTYYPEAFRSAIRVIGTDDVFGTVASMFMLIFKERVYFFADTTVNIDPSAMELAGIAQLTAKYVKKLGYKPRIAMLSFSNFGSVNHEKTQKVKRAVEIIKRAVPDLMVDGEMQADTAVLPELIESTYPFANLRGGANILVFPDLQSANIAYKLCSKLSGAEAIGPILMGLRKSAHILPHGCEVDDVVNMAAIAVAEI